MTPDLNHRNRLNSWILAGLLLASGCSTKEPVYTPIDENFCGQIHADAAYTLSKQLELVAMDTIGRTGVYTLEEGDASMISRAWLCDAAEKTIDVQYFIFSSDNVGLIAVDYLLRAADRGVHVRIIVDDIMVEADADELLALDQHPNLSIKIYNPTSNIGKHWPGKLFNLMTDFRGFNQRMHNKTFVVDGKVAITGGRNMADEYFDYDHTYNFRDRDVLLIGKAVLDVENSFNQFWDSALSVSISEIAPSSNHPVDTAIAYAYLHQYACNPANFWPQIREKILNVPTAFQQVRESGDLVWVDQVSFLSDVPGKNNGDHGLGGGGVTTDSLISLIQRARRSISIQSPYLITTGLSQQLFKSVIDRGVEVKILTNSLSSTDNLEAFSGYQRERSALLDIGVKIYEFKPDAAIRFTIMTGALQQKLNFTPIFGLHAKSMVIDEETAVIGTFNLDPRSANLNTECIAVIRDERIAANLYDAMERDMLLENAWQTTKEFNPDAAAGWKKRLGVWFRGVMPKAVL